MYFAIFVLVVITPLGVNSIIEFEDESIEQFLSGVPHSKKEDAKVAQSLCEKLKSCQPDFEKVCGYDEYWAHLNLFENRCDLYKTNCEGKRFYRPIRMGVCEARARFLETQGLKYQSYTPSMGLRKKTSKKFMESARGPNSREAFKNAFEKRVNADFDKWISGKEYKHSARNFL